MMTKSDDENVKINNTSKPSYICVYTHVYMYIYYINAIYITKSRILETSG